MRVLMLGWEFPPFIAGGLGVACYGLTKALDRLGHQILFILPRPVDRSQSSHIKLLSPAPSRRARSEPRAGRGIPDTAHAAQGEGVSDAAGDRAAPEFEHVTFKGVEAAFESPYPGGGAVGGREPEDALAPLARESLGEAPGAGRREGSPPAPIGGHQYSGDLVADAERYARLVVALARREHFDVIHAHDWLTYPAGIALS